MQLCDQNEQIASPDPVQKCYSKNSKFGRLPAVFTTVLPNFIAVSRFNDDREPFGTGCRGPTGSRARRHINSHYCRFRPLKNININSWSCMKIKKKHKNKWESKKKHFGCRLTRIMSTMVIRRIENTIKISHMITH